MWILGGFFVLNLVGVIAITLILIDAASHGRDGTLASMRGTVRSYFSAKIVEAILADPKRQASPRRWPTSAERRTSRSGPRRSRESARSQHDDRAPG